MMRELQPVLMVDDSAEDYHAIVRAFRRTRMRRPITWCKDGEQALEYLRASPTDEKSARPALILLDLNMPKIDGFEVLAELKADANLSSIPVVVLSTSSDDEDVRRSYASGANSYVPKPAAFDDLVEATKVISDYWFDTALLPDEA